MYLARILLVEDYDDLREMVSELLREMEHLVEAVADGAAAITALNKQEFDLLILDWEVPHVPGIEICKHVRSLGRTTPVLMLTGKKAIVDKEQGFDAGADDYLTKPFHPKELLSRIKALLRRSEVATAVQPGAGQMEPGTIFVERYQIVNTLGRGSTGTIYKAMHLFLNRFVALKVLHPQLIAEPESVARFKREAQAISTLSHPNIISIYDFGISAQGGTPYLVMDFSEGMTLSEYVKGLGRLTPKEAVPIFLQACDALAHAHEHGIIHRDVKPGNILLVKDTDGTQTLKLVDFGIAKMPLGGQSLQVTQNGDVLGSPLYMSPEQCMGSTLDTRTDIFSLGCVMHVALTGNDPFIGDNVLDTMYKRTVEDAKSILKTYPHIALPQALDAIVLKALARHAQNRYQTMVELKADLEKILCVLA